MDTRHPDDGAIQAYVEGQLDKREHRRVAEHAAGCARCTDAVAEARGLIAAASRIVGALDGVPVAVAPPVRRNSRPHWLAAAATLVFAAGITSIVTRSESHGPDAVTSREAQIAPTAEQPSAALETSEASGVLPPQPSAPANSQPVGTTVRSFANETPVQAGSGARQPVMDAQAAAVSVPAARDPGKTVENAPPPTAFVSGRVTSTDGRALRGANVIVVGTSASTITDSSGSYRLAVPATAAAGDSATILGRAVGRVSQTRTVSTEKGEARADLQLPPHEVALEEVVVTGSDMARTQRRAAAGAAAAAAPAAPAPAAQALPAPLRTVRYEVRPGVEVELREYADARTIPPPSPDRPEFRWRNPDSSRAFVLSGPLAIEELEILARRLSELKVVR